MSNARKTLKRPVRKATRNGRDWTSACGSAKVLLGDCLEVLRKLPDESVHCVVTSPPYWGLRSYLPDGHRDKHLELGLEETPEAYVQRLVDVFREVRRVLRKDGTCWVVIGDSYCSTDKWGGGVGGNTGKHTTTDDGECPSWAVRKKRDAIPGIKPKDLVGIPWRVAFALQADGWWLRQDIIWHKPNAMPESVTDRCTKAHEYIFLMSKSDQCYCDHEYVFLLAKSERYFYDAEAVKEPSVEPPRAREKRNGESAVDTKMRGHDSMCGNDGTRNRRSVWTVTTRAYAGAHFATYPPALIEPCVLAGTSAKGCCPRCGAPWKRVVERGQSTYARIKEQTGYDWRDMQAQSKANGTALKAGVDACGGTRLPNGTQPHFESVKLRTVGWQPTCECKDVAVTPEPVPCTVLDPFNGSGTTGAVAMKWGRNYIGIDLNPDYLKLAKKRISDAIP